MRSSQANLLSDQLENNASESNEKKEVYQEMASTFTKNEDS